MAKTVIFTEVSLQELGEAKIGDLEYGTIIKTKDQPGSVYSKLNKRDTGKDVTLHSPAGSSIILNLKLGTLRCISGSAVVIVMDAELSYSRTTTPDQYKKGY